MIPRCLTIPSARCLPFGHDGAQDWTCVATGLPDTVQTVAVPSQKPPSRSGQMHQWHVNALDRLIWSASGLALMQLWHVKNSSLIPR